MSIYEKTQLIYHQIRDKMQDLGCEKVPYFICDEMPNIKAKYQVISFAKALGLKTDNKGTLRLTVLAPEFNAAGEKLLSWYKSEKYEVYLHLCHRKKDYFSAKDSRNMLTLGFYVGS